MSLKRPLDLVRALHEEAISPEVAALLIARDARPDLDVDAELARIDAIASDLSLDPSASPREQARALSGHLFERLGFRGNEDDYYDPRNSYLDEVLRLRTGIPITLCVLTMAVGRRVGVEVEGIGFPGHFLARVGGADGVYVDPFFGGRVVDEAALERLAARMLGSAARLSPEHLAPVGLRPLAVRMLLNLKRCHEHRQERTRALVVCDRLVDLTGQASFRRDRGLHALALGAREQAVEDLEAYLASVEGGAAKDEAMVRRALGVARAAGQRPPS